MCTYFRAAERADQHLTDYIVFPQDSFGLEYSLEERTYVVTSNNKAYRPNMGGYSIFASSLDGSDFGVSLDYYMADERGGADGWKIERCYMEAAEVKKAKTFLKRERKRALKRQALKFSFRKEIIVV